MQPLRSVATTAATTPSALGNPTAAIAPKTATATATTTANKAGPKIRIAPPPLLPWPSLGELWRYRETIVLLAQRDIQIRYKQTVFGPIWALLSPLFQMLVFVALFARLARLPHAGLPPWIFYLTGIIVWRYFAAVLTGAGNSLINHAGLIKKVYFPRLGLALVPALANLTDLAIGLGTLTIAALLYGHTGGSALKMLLWIPLIALTAILGWGTGALLAACSIRTRDLRLATPMLTQLWMYCSIIVPYERVEATTSILKYLYPLNPMLGIVETARAIVQPNVNWQHLSTLLPLSVGITCAIWLIGTMAFERAQAYAADWI
jgi:lipopolysaccharide transport system permease protein